MTAILEMYITLMPAVFAGILNMLWCKLRVCSVLSVPMDGGRTMRDGHRIFGGNKTWKGFVGMIMFGCLFTVLWGALCAGSETLEGLSYLYRSNRNTLPYNALMGAAFGLAYALCELPNSFLKRRLDITPGKTCSGGKKAFFVFLDQADSMFGCVGVVCIVYKMTAGFYFAYVLLGALTHIVLNMLLYLCHLRKNPF